MSKVLYTLLLAVLLTSCSSKDLYEVGQDYSKNECIGNARTSEEHLACTNATPKPYKDYEKERQAVINK